MTTEFAKLFLSAVTNEFGSFREAVRVQIDRRGIRIETQESFLAHGDRTLIMLDDYVADCDAVVHLFGEMSGEIAPEASRKAILDRYPDLSQKLQLDQKKIQQLSYSQWEAWLAIYHGISLYIAPALPGVKVDNPLTDSVEAARQRQSQQDHIAALNRNEFYASDKLAFETKEHLVIALLRTLHDFLPSIVVPISPELPPSATDSGLSGSS